MVRNASRQHYGDGACRCHTSILLIAASTVAFPVSVWKEPQLANVSDITKMTLLPNPGCAFVKK